MSAVTWSSSSRDGRARTGVLNTPHGSVNTPAFMPVGTRAAVRAVDVDDLVAVGTDIVLANTYHLMLRPGADAVADLGGLHGFWGWSGPILTDSGGFQIYSLRPRIEEGGASFRSSYDGGLISLSPEQAVRIQELMGADIAMVLDVCLGLPAPREEVAAAMDRTLRWAERSRTAHTRSDQALFGIVQGGVDPELRAESAARTALLDFAGFGIGGLSVGETALERNLALDAAFSELPAGMVRYVMGLGDPEGVMAAIERGADLFDCVWPTRLARHGRVFAATGDFNLRRAEYLRDGGPLEESCTCHTCRHHHRAYLRHLLATNELSAFRLLSIHNLTYTLGLLEGIRKAISSQTLAAHLATIRAMRVAGPSG
ncbi:MAG TPA: tRNA guanosine(34) transglycosylase Tgt [Acidimicrobiia bacterium]|nr:tRNA guanosine(34) transglycosylase Tgt [Acidimicrobiia bacterium]